MSLRDSLRACSLACCAVAIAALGALALASGAGAFSLGGTYLALGDSLTYGYHQAQFGEELKKGEVNPATFDEGYVNDFSRVPETRQPETAAHQRRVPGRDERNVHQRLGRISGFCAGGPTGTPFPYSLPAPPLHRRLAAWRRAGDPRKQPQRQPDLPGHRGERRAAVPGAHVRLPGDRHLQHRHR